MGESSSVLLLQTNGFDVIVIQLEVAVAKTNPTEGELLFDCPRLEPVVKVFVCTTVPSEA